MKMGIWLRKAVLFAAVLGALGAVSKTVEASADRKSTRLNSSHI